MARVAALPPTGSEAVSFAQNAIDALGLDADDDAAYYTVDPVPDDPSAANERSVDLHDAVDDTLWIAVLALTPAPDPGKTCAVLWEQAKKAHHHPILLNVGFIPDEVVLGMDDVDPCPGEGTTDQGRQMIWEVSTGRTVKDEGRVPLYARVDVEGDTTRGLSQRGVVRLRLPGDATHVGIPQPSAPELMGTGAFPPEIEDDDKAARVLFWLRATPRDPRRLERALYVGFNAVEVVQSRRAATEFLGTGTGEPAQEYELAHDSVLVGSLTIQVEEDRRWIEWQAVDGFEASTVDSRHYRLDPEAGKVHFGNGLRGRAPQIGERIRALTYRYGGGPEGNVGAGAIAKVTGHPDVLASNVLPARGGAAKEAITDALERIPGEFRRHDRAVTQSDFQELALATPGAGVGRAECLPLFHPPTKNPEAAGVVSVVVWPREDRKRPNAPMPDRTLLRHVCAWLDARRLVTTELYVIPPTYRKVAVAVGLHAKPGYGIEALRRWVELVIRQYLAPLPPYGPEGRGWPLGQTVFGPELVAAALQVEGVQFLDGLEVAAFDESTRTWVAAPAEGVELARWEVPELAEITVVQGPPMTPGDQLGAPAPDKVAVPVPTLREEC
jgi:predicted phage baseplate assembly protein